MDQSKSISMKPEQKCFPGLLNTAKKYYYTPCKQSLGWGGYIGITMSVRPSMYLVSATPTKLPIEFL